MHIRGSRRAALFATIVVLIVGAAVAAGASPDPGGYTPRSDSAAGLDTDHGGDAAASTADSSAKKPAAAASARTDNGFGIPPWNSTHPNGKVGQRFDVQTTATRPKVVFHLPPVSAVVYLYLCFNFGGNAHCVDPAGDPSVLNGYPNTGDLGLAVGYGPTWLQSGHGASRPFGELAAVKVAALAFGSIPVTAVVHISQPLGPRYVQPLQLKFAASLTNAGKGTVLPGFPYGPAPYASNSAYFPSTIDGPIDVRLSNVRVDQEPVPVGPDCHAPTSTLHLFSPSGWANAAEGPERGKPGEYQGLGSTDFGYLQGNADVGSFTGCHNGADDLDPLLTAFISSDDNPVDVDVTSGLINWCTHGVGSVDCAPYDDVTAASAAKNATSRVPAAVLSSVPAPLARILTRRNR